MADTYEHVLLPDTQTYKRLKELEAKYGLTIVVYPKYWNGDDAVCLAFSHGEQDYPAIMIRQREYPDRAACADALIKAWDAAENSPELQQILEGHRLLKEAEGQTKN